MFLFGSPLAENISHFCNIFKCIFWVVLFRFPVLTRNRQQNMNNEAKTLRKKFSKPFSGFFLCGVVLNAQSHRVFLAYLLLGTLTVFCSPPLPGGKGNTKIFVNRSPESEEDKRQSRGPALFGGRLSHASYLGFLSQKCFGEFGRWPGGGARLLYSSFTFGQKSLENRAVSLSGCGLSVGTPRFFATDLLPFGVQKLAPLGPQWSGKLLMGSRHRTQKNAKKEC